MKRWALICSMLLWCCCSAIAQDIKEIHWDKRGIAVPHFGTIVYKDVTDSTFFFRTSYYAKEKYFMKNSENASPKELLFDFLGLAYNSGADYSKGAEEVEYNSNGFYAKYIKGTTNGKDIFSAVTSGEISHKIAYINIFYPLGKDGNLNNVLKNNRFTN